MCDARVVRPVLMPGRTSLELSDSDSVLGTSPTSPLDVGGPLHLLKPAGIPVPAQGPATPNMPSLHAVTTSATASFSSTSIPSQLVQQPAGDAAFAGAPAGHAPSSVAPMEQDRAPPSFLTVSLQTIIGCSEMLGHQVEDRSSIAVQQDPDLAAMIQAGSSLPLRSPAQRHLFTVAPLDVLMTRDERKGRNTFHIIELNGTGYAGMTNTPAWVIEAIMQSFSELPARLAHVADPVILVASSGQESYPPVSRTMHEKIMYIEALKRGFESLRRTVAVTNMTRLEKDPKAMPAAGPTLVLGYMKQFRAAFSLGAQGELMLAGRQVSAAINDRFVLNTLYQFDHRVDLNAFMGHNACFTAGADKGVAYTLYNQFFSTDEAVARFPFMAPSMNFSRAHTRDQLVQEVQTRLRTQHRPVVIKPQGTGCGHGIEFFFGDESVEEVRSKVDEAISTVCRNYSLACGGLPFTVCEFLDTASISDAAAKAHDGLCAASQPEAHPMAGHKFELRVVVYRDGDMLRAYPSIAKVAPEEWNPETHSKSSLINNITTSAKSTNKSGSEFMLPLVNTRTLNLLGIQPQELVSLCAAATAYVRHIIDTTEDSPATLELPAVRLL